jgi:flagellar protein FliS
MQSALKALNAYARVETDTAVQSADPHKLILMLYEGAAIAIADARRHMQARDYSAKGASITKAMMIIQGGLKASLDVKAGGQLGERLDALYQYMIDRLLAASTHNDAGMLDEVSRLIGELKTAWAAIGKQAAAEAPVPPARAAATYGKV